MADSDVHLQGNRLARVVEHQQTRSRCDHRVAEQERDGEPPCVPRHPRECPREEPDRADGEHHAGDVHLTVGEADVVAAKAARRRVGLQEVGGGAPRRFDLFAVRESSEEVSDDATDDRGEERGGDSDVGRAHRSTGDELDHGKARSSHGQAEDAVTYEWRVDPEANCGGGGGDDHEDHADQRQHVAAVERRQRAADVGRVGRHRETEGDEPPGGRRHGHDGERQDVHSATMFADESDGNDQGDGHRDHLELRGDGERCGRGSDQEPRRSIVGNRHRDRMHCNGDREDRQCDRSRAGGDVGQRHGRDHGDRAGTSRPPAEQSRCGVGHRGHGPDGEEQRGDTHCRHPERVEHRLHQRRPQARSAECSDATVHGATFGGSEPEQLGGGRLDRSSCDFDQVPDREGGDRQGRRPPGRSPPGHRDRIGCESHDRGTTYHVHRRLGERLLVGLPRLRVVVEWVAMHADRDGVEAAPVQQLPTRRE